MRVRRFGVLGGSAAVLVACFPSLPPEADVEPDTAEVVDTAVAPEDTVQADDTAAVPDAGECAGPADCAHVAATCLKPACVDRACVAVADDGAACDDGDPCTRDDTCAGATCAGVAYTCDDAVACTDDVCDGEGGCSYPVTAGRCHIAGVCYAAGDSPADDPCRVCEQGEGWSMNDGAVCDDGLVCTGSDLCAGGTCGGAALGCAPPAVSCATASCVEEAGGCVNDLSACECTGDGDCGPQGRCDGNACVCVPACVERACGPDGCGDSCGSCEAGEACTAEGQCVCAPACEGKACGDDGCDGSCGSCAVGHLCDDAQQCVPLTCDGIVCPSLAGFAPTCNAADHCEYGRVDATEVWHADGVWIYVPPGSFPKGTPVEEADWLHSERPVHTVTFVQGFYFAKYEVTTRVYEACEAAAACTAPDTGGVDGLNRSTNGRALHPQNGLSWEQAGEVCAWLGGRRPSESEWEYAAKGRDGHRRYPWGDTPEPTCDNDTAVFTGDATGAHPDDAGEPGCGVGGTWQVGQKPEGASAVGALDMAGNAIEWVEDCCVDMCFDGYPAATPTDGSAWSGCASPGRVTRGGSYIDAAISIRASSRSSAFQAAALETGARCVRTFAD